MIVRRGMNVKYSMDEEALVAWLLSLREFAGVDAATLTTWLDPLRDYSYSADYYTIEEGGEYWSFEPASKFLYVTQEVRDRIVRVAIWNAQQTAHELIVVNGFSCLCCGSRTPHAESPRGSYYLFDLLRGRQTISMPPLVCMLCGGLLWSLFGGASAAQRIDGYVDGMIQRARSAGRVAA